MFFHDKQTSSKNFIRNFEKKWYQIPPPVHFLWNHILYLYRTEYNTVITITTYSKIKKTSPVETKGWDYDIK